MIEVQPRTVAAPWERPKIAPGGVEVGREAYVEPEPGPLADYLGRFPHRYVAWDVERQLWEIRQTNPLSGLDERVELVFFYDTPPPESDSEIMEAEQQVERELRGLVQGAKGLDLGLLAELEEQARIETLGNAIDANDPDLVKVFRHFDHEFVRKRVRQAFEFEHLGAEATTARRADKNRRLALARHRDFTRETAAFLGEMRRWLPAITDGHAGARIPLVAGGLTK